MKLLLLPLLALALVAALLAAGFRLEAPFTGQVTQSARDSLAPETFENLPPFPEDFYSVLKEINSGNRLITDVGEGYYKQPEFYPTFTQNIGLMKSGRQHWGVLGYGAFPSDVRVTAGRDGELAVTTIIHSSWLVETYQGLRMTTVLGEGLEDYFDVSIEPEAILLEPSYPRFGSNWARKITFRVRMKDPPAGDYLIGANPSAPPGEASREWASGFQGKYTEVGGFGVGRPLFQIHLTIL